MSVLARAALAQEAVPVPGLVWSGLADWVSSGKKELSARVYVAFQDQNHLKRPHHLRGQLLF
jgi:hypothetical protein